AFRADRRRHERRAAGAGIPRASGAMHSSIASAELGQESHVAAVEQPDVGDAVAHHRDALRSHSAGPSAPALRIEPTIAEHRLVHHSATEDLHPAGSLAGATTAAAAEQAADIHLSRRLGEREERRPEAHPGALAQELPCEVRERGLEVDEADPLVDSETLD